MKKRKLFMDVLSNAAVFILFFNMFAFVYISIYGLAPWAYLIMALPFFFLLFLRKKVKTPAVFIPAHLVFIILPLFIFDTNIIIILTGCFAIASVIYSVRVKLTRELSLQGITIIAILGILAAIFLMLDASDLLYAPGVRVLLIFSAIASIILAAVHTHMEGMEAKVSVLRDMHKKIVSKDVLCANYKMAAVFVAVLVIFGALSMFFPAGRILQGLMQLLILPARLFDFIRQLIFRGTDIETRPGTGLISDLADFLEMGEYEPVEGFARNPLLGNIARILLITIAVAAVMVFFIYIIKKLRNVTDRQSHYEEAVMPETAIEKLKFALRDIAAFLPRLKAKPSHPIRKIYIKKVNGHIKQGVMILPSHNTDVIADKIRQNEDIDELTKRYEAVRYGKN